MNNLDFEFEDSALDKFLNSLYDNDRVNAYELLAMLEGEDEETVEDVFGKLEELTVDLDLKDLPRPQYSGDSGVRLKWEMEISGSEDLLRKLEENDPLAVYLQEIAAIPACGDICLLAEELGAANRKGETREDLRETIMNLSLSRVVELSRTYTGWGVLLLDLIQEGSLGLWKATECYVGKGIYFELDRDWWIAFYMKKAVILQARESGTGQKLRTALEDYRAVDQRLLSELGRNATIEEIAEELHMSPEEASVVKKMLDNAHILAQAKKVPEPEEETEEDDQAVENTALFQMRQRIQDLLSELDAQDVKLLTLRFGLEGGLPLNPEETGRKLGLTPDEVVAREAAALAKLRKA